VDCSPPDSSVHGILQARILEWGCHFLLQGIFLTQRLNPHLLCLLHWQAGSFYCTTYEALDEYMHIVKSLDVTFGKRDITFA